MQFLPFSSSPNLNRTSHFVEQNLGNVLGLLDIKPLLLSAHVRYSPLQQRWKGSRPCCTLWLGGWPVEAQTMWEHQDM